MRARRCWNHVVLWLTVCSPHTAASTWAEVPPGAPEAAKPAAAASETRPLLTATELKGREVESGLNALHQAAQRQAADAADVDYAYGVMLARSRKTRAALAVFAERAASETAPHLPSLKAAFWLQLQARDWKAAAASASALSTHLQDRPDLWADPAAQTADARWLGQSMAAAQLLSTSADDVKAWARLDQQVRQTSPAPVLAAYRDGFEATLDLRVQLTQATEEATEQARATQAEEQEDARRTIVQKQRQIDSNREQLQLTAADSRKRYDDRLAELGQQLGTMEAQWKELDEQRQSLDKSIFILGQEMTLLHQQYNTLARGAGNRQGSANRNQLQAIDQQLAQRQQQMFQYQAEREQVVAGMNTIQRQALDVLAARQAAAGELQKISGEIVRQDDQLATWKKRLTKDASKLEESPTGSGDHSVKAQTLKLRSIATYVPMDWEAERQRLLAEIDAP